MVLTVLKGDNRSGPNAQPLQKAQNRPSNQIDAGAEMLATTKKSADFFNRPHTFYAHRSRLNDGRQDGVNASASNQRFSAPRSNPVTRTEYLFSSKWRIVGHGRGNRLIFEGPERENAGRFAFPRFF
jgi:hypothetical protein